ncbi:MAG: hypothetical protein ABSB58_03105 [Gemmatimonadales bacterium]|jgi:hypothetical protein
MTGLIRRWVITAAVGAAGTGASLAHGHGSAVARALAAIRTDAALDALNRVDTGDDVQLRAIIDRALSKRRYQL